MMIKHKTLTKTALRKFIVWTTSRYNEWKKRDVVDFVLAVLNGERTIDENIQVFQCGSYTPSSAMTHGNDYWLNVSERSLSKGRAHWKYETRTWEFFAEEKIIFN